MNEQSKAKYILELTADQERIVERACEFYARVLCAQFDELADELMFKHIREQDFINRRDKMKEILTDLKQCAFPELGNFSHYGVGYSEETDAAWDVYQVVRNRRAWTENPDGGVTVDFSTPIEFSKSGLPKCIVIKE